MNDQVNCRFCDVKLKPSDMNDEYFVCPTCQTMIKSYNMNSEPLQYLEKKYVNTALKGDLRHYNKMFNGLRSNESFRHITNVTYDKIHCFGGGFPKLESYFDHNEILVYDMNASLYRDNINLFNDVYRYKKTIKYIDFIISKDTYMLDSIDINKPQLITFVHLLEHLPQSLILHILNNLLQVKHKFVTNMSNDNYRFIIYQPNPSKASNKSWGHFKDPSHITLIPFVSMVSLLTYNKLFELEYFNVVDDDMFIVFK